MTEDIKEQVRKNTRMLNHHIGLGGDAHAAVNDVNAGFMTPTQKTMLEKASSDAANARGNRIEMPAGTDVLTLPAGRYEIWKALNNPVGPDDGSLIEYDVSTIFDGRRQIEACVSSNGRRYYRSIHTGGGADSGSGGWDYQPFVIWSGSITTGTLQYPVPMLSFMKGVRVLYSTASGQRGSFEAYGRTSGSTVYDIGNNPDNPDNTFQNYEIGISYDLTSLTINRNNMIVVSPSGISEGDKNLVTIYRVYAI